MYKWHRSLSYTIFLFSGGLSFHLDSHVLQNTIKEISFHEKDCWQLVSQIPNNSNIYSVIKGAQDIFAQFWSFVLFSGIMWRIKSSFVVFIIATLVYITIYTNTTFIIDDTAEGGPTQFRNFYRDSLRAQIFHTLIALLFENRCVSNKKGRLGKTT